MQGVSAKVNQRKQFLHMREITLYLVHILIELVAFFPMCLFHCLDMSYQFFVLTFKGGDALLQFLSFRFQLIAAQKRTYLCHECRFCLSLGGFQLLRPDLFPDFGKQPFCPLVLGLQLPYVGFKFSRLPSQVTVVLGGGGVPCFRTSYATLQAVLRHHCGIVVMPLYKRMRKEKARLMVCTVASSFHQPLCIVGGLLRLHIPIYQYFITLIQQFNRISKFFHQPFRDGVIPAHTSSGLVTVIAAVLRRCPDRRCAPSLP